MTSRIGIVDDATFDQHRPSSAHPERPERLAAAREGCASIPAEYRVSIPFRVATPSEIGDVHAFDHVEVLAETLRSGSGFLDPDTYFGTGSHDAVFGAVGGVIDLTRALVEGRVASGFALIRPPGHHARPDNAMGFCFLNNIAIAAQHAIASGVPRVAIVDWDVHHGNGTQEMFYGNGRVLFISLHQYPFYPGTGHPREIGVRSGAGKTVNLALPAGSTPEVYGQAFRRVVLPVLRQFDPALILVSAGFDAHARDPLAEMELDASTYGAMASALLTVGAKVEFVLEGGYHLIALRDSIDAVCKAARGARYDLPAGTISSAAAAAIATTESALEAHWQFDRREA